MKTRNMTEKIDVLEVPERRTPGGVLSEICDRLGRSDFLIEVREANGKMYVQYDDEKFSEEEKVRMRAIIDDIEGVNK